MAAWYPVDEPNLRWNATQLGLVTAAIKAASSIPVLVTLSNPPVNISSGTLDYALDTEHVGIRGC